MAQYIITPKTGERIFANIEDEVTDVGYRQYSIDFHAKSIAHVILEMIEMELGPCWYPSVLQNVVNTAYSIAEEQIESLRVLDIPGQIKTILTDDTLKKKDQISLLKGVEITAEQLGAIFLYAEEYGYLYTSIRKEIEPKQFDLKDVPSFIYLTEAGGVDYSGETMLSDGQLKSVIDQSNFIVARFLTRGSNWHCFVQDRRGITGMESGRVGSVPHLHYCSSAFGLALNDVKRAVRNGSYPHTPVHIPLKQYRS